MMSDSRRFEVAMFGYDRDDNADVGRDMIRTVLYTFGAFVLVAVVLIIAQSL